MRLVECGGICSLLKIYSQNDSAKIAIVIPYFQRLTCILLKAVRSALAQWGEFTITIVIVDDASPVPVRSELHCCSRIRTRSASSMQDNAGPAAARNKALDRLTA